MEGTYQPTRLMIWKVNIHCENKQYKLMQHTAAQLALLKEAGLVQVSENEDEKGIGTPQFT